MRSSNLYTECGTWGMLATAALMMTFLSGCGGDPYASKYTKTQPNSQAFTGEWRLKEWTMKRAQSLPSPVPGIVFRGDGSFVATNYPGVAINGFNRGMASVDGQGNWSLEQYQGSWIVRFHWRIIAGTEPGYVQMLHILNDQPPYVLHHIIGDPDSGEALVFRLE